MASMPSQLHTVRLAGSHRRNRSERAERTEPQPQSCDSTATLELHNAPSTSRQRKLSWQNEGRMPVSGDSNSLRSKLITAIVPHRRRDVGGCSCQICQCHAHHEASSVVVRQRDGGRELALERHRAL